MGNENTAHGGTQQKSIFGFFPLGNFTSFEKDMLVCLTNDKNNLPVKKKKKEKKTPTVPAIQQEVPYIVSPNAEVVVVVVHSVYSCKILTQTYD